MTNSKQYHFGSPRFELRALCGFDHGGGVGSRNVGLLQPLMRLCAYDCSYQMPVTGSPSSPSNSVALKENFAVCGLMAATDNVSRVTCGLQQKVIWYRCRHDVIPAVRVCVQLGARMPASCSSAPLASQDGFFIYYRNSYMHI